jgi:hypothetical protein
MSEILGARQEVGRKKNTVKFLHLVSMENSPQDLCSTIRAHRSIDERRPWSRGARRIGRYGTPYRIGMGSMLDGRRFMCARPEPRNFELPMSGLEEESRNARAS